MFGHVVPPQPEWSRPSFVYDANAIVHIPSSILLNHFFLQSDLLGHYPRGPSLDPHKPGALTELSSLLTLQNDSTICAGSDLPQLPPEGAWGSQPNVDFANDSPFIPPPPSNRPYPTPVVPPTQPEYPATQQTTPQYPNFNIDPRLYQVRTRHTPSPMVDSF